ncbi:glycosyltransferase family 4 protein [Polynucleobacter paneuropaeus]|nr:glycosyltransferase family 4 protein [Polynucleobacter paneuropaeus]
MKLFGKLSQGGDKKRILHLHPNGEMAAIFVAPLLKFERNHGYESRIITSTRSLKQFDGLEIPYDLKIRNLFGLPLAFIKLCYYLHTYKPDLVITHNFKSSLLPLLASRLMGTPIRVYFNHGVPYVGYDSVFRIMLKGLEALNIYLATEVITVSKDMQDLLQQVNSKKTISLIANGSACGIDLHKHIAGQYDRLSFFAKYGFSKDDIIFTYIGRPEIRKGFVTILDLWTKHLQFNTAHRLFLCGPSESDVIKVIGAVPNRLHCLGFTQNVPEILSNTKYFLLTSFHEGLPYAVLEAMASGCIVIANNIDGIKALIQNGVNGFLVDNNSLKDYEAIVSFLEHQTQVFQDSIKGEAIKTASLYSRDAFLVAYKEFISRRLSDYRNGF